MNKEEIELEALSIAVEYECQKPFQKWINWKDKYRDDTVYFERCYDEDGNLKNLESAED